MARAPDEATRLAQQLDEVNRQRRLLQQTIEAAAQARIAQQYGEHPPAAIVLGDPEWHHGVVGIVAARIAETYHRPTFLLQIHGDTARGSGRSIPAFDLYRGLQHCAQWLRQFGGHKYAAGLTMDAAHVPYLQEELIRFAEDHLTSSDLQPTLYLDAYLPMAEVTPALVEQLAAFAPYGAGNPAPLLGAQDVQRASAIRSFGPQGQHARFRVAQNGTTLEVVAFQQAERVQALPPEARLDIAFTPTLNTWGGRSQVELHLRALRLHDEESRHEGSGNDF
jgi:single-stranded-DNA-specific exonuclease